jgi:hypothetical protein
MTDSNNVDDHIRSQEALDMSKHLVSPDATKMRNASGAKVVDASKGNNQDGSAWRDKELPKPVDYKSIRLVEMGVIAPLSKAQRSAEGLKPPDEQHITFNELLTFEKQGNLDARHLVNIVDAAYQCTDKDLKRATLNTIQDTADRVFQRGQYAESLQQSSLPPQNDLAGAHALRPDMPIRQLSKVEEIQEGAKSPGQRHLTPLELEGFVAGGDKHAILLSKELDAACNVNSTEQRNALLADVQNRADRYYRRGEYFTGEQVDLKPTFLNRANASIDQQFSGLGPAAVKGVGDGLKNVGKAIAFGASATFEGIKLVGQVLNYEFEELSRNHAAADSAQVGRETEADWMKRYAEPVGHGIEKALEPMNKDAENIGFTGDYGRLVTDPLKYAGQQYEQFSSQSAPQQVEQLSGFATENVVTGIVMKGAENFAEAAKDIGGAAGTGFANGFADLATSTPKTVVADGTIDDEYLAMSKADGQGDAKKPGTGNFENPGKPVEIFDEPPLLSDGELLEFEPSAGVEVRTIKVENPNAWDDLGRAPRGKEFHKEMGENLPPNHQGIDHWELETGIATSFKTRDLRLDSYKSYDGLYSRLKADVHDLKTNWKGHINTEYVQVIPNDVTAKRLDIAIPDGAMTTTQKQAVADMAKEAALDKIILRLTVIK